MKTLRVLGPVVFGFCFCANLLAQESLSEILDPYVKDQTFSGTVLLECRDQPVETFS